MSERRDEILSGVAEDGLRWFVTDVTQSVETARQLLDLSPLAATALGRVMASSALLFWASRKSLARLSVTASGSGVIERIFAELDSEGNLRGLCAPTTPVGADGAGDLGVGRALGKGLLKVSRQGIKGRFYESQVALHNGEIGTDVAYFLEQSEQRQCAVTVGAFLQPRGVSSAGGLLVEALPDADRDRVLAIEANLGKLESVSRTIEQRGCTGLVDQIFGSSARVLESQELRFHCRCSRESLRGQLVLLEEQELAELLDENGELVAECAFCGAIHRFAGTELREAN